MRATPAVLVDVAVWACWGTAVGAAATRIPGRVVAADGWLTRIRRWERDGRLWLLTGIRHWKDLVPEAGALFGGISKRHLIGRGPAALDRMAAETRRAELCHWAVMAAVVLMPIWNPAWLTSIMVVYAVAANAPCIVIQRYNRARIGRLARRRVVTAASSAGRGI